MARHVIWCMHRLFCFTVVIMLSACNNSNSDGGDVFAPGVTNTYPESNATGVARDSAITASFSEDVIYSTVNDSSFLLARTDGLSEVSGVVTFNGVTNAATFMPDADLSLLTRYTATLTNAIKDISGNALSGNYVWTFTTADGSWNAAAPIEFDNTSNAGHPKVKFGADGNAIAVWSQSDGVRFNVLANGYAVRTGWATPVLLETDNAGDALYPQVGIDGSGNAIAVWQQSDGVHTNIWANRYMAGVGWGTAELIETDNVGNATDPQLTVDVFGNAIVVWTQFDGIRVNVWSTRYSSGAGWSVPVLIETDNAGNAAYPQIASDYNGNALAVWQQDDGIRYNIMANRYFVGSGWGVAELIESGPIDAERPQIAIDTSGNALAVWQQSDTARYNIWSNRYVAGIGWGVAALIEHDDTADAIYPQVSMDENGGAMAVWEQSDGSRHNIWANHYSLGMGWDTAVLIENDPGFAEYPQIVTDVSGNALAVWLQWDDVHSVYNVWASRYASGSGWGSATRIENDDAGTADIPHISMDERGGALAVWSQFDGARYNIIANRFE